MICANCVLISRTNFTTNLIGVYSGIRANTLSACGYFRGLDIYGSRIQYERRVSRSVCACEVGTEFSMVTS